MTSNLNPSIRRLKQTVKIAESYMGSAKRNIREIEKEIKRQEKLLRSEKARLRRLEAKKPMYECGIKVLEEELSKRARRQ